MVTLRPVARALVPIDTDAAQKIMGPNYDEFQSTKEVWDIIQANPQSILRVTMAHCDTSEEAGMIADGSEEALARSSVNMKELIDSPLTRIAEDVLWVYEIVDPRRPGVRQIGLGANATTSEIRSESNPSGSLVRNEGVREPKARGRADLIEATQSAIGMVNMAVSDAEGKIATALESYADARPADFAATDEHGNDNRVWLIEASEDVDRFIALFAKERSAYVADGNHRSAAAAMLGRESFPAVFFTVDRMGIAPYNRLVSVDEVSNLTEALSEAFDVSTFDAVPESLSVHEICLYDGTTAYKLVPKASSYDPDNAVQVIDADIVQRKIFADIFGIQDSGDSRLTFVGGNKDSAYLKGKVDAGDHRYAILLAPVTMQQFVDVCEQSRFMPPKSTWFDPKVRSGLVSSLF